jgi:pyridoxamine 5'-phosphate oxidase family protein
VTIFTDAELQYLVGGRQLGRLATVGRDGTPHVVPVGWIYNAASQTIDISGHDLARTKKFRDVARSGRAAIVIDDLASVDPWRPRGVKVRGDAVLEDDGGRPRIRIRPRVVWSWGINTGAEKRFASIERRTVS